MAQITKAVRQAHGYLADWIPVQVLKAIDETEMADRIAHAEELLRKARDPATDRVLKGFYSGRARAVLTAQPRATTELEVARRHAAACRAPDARRADTLRRDAARILEQHPVAPRRADVAKARLAKAMPEEVAQRHAELTAKANRLPPGPQQDAIRQQAERLLEESLYPTPENQAANTGPVVAPGTTHLGLGKTVTPQVPPGRQVAKAALPVAVYNQQRRLTGVVDPARIVQRVAKAKAADEPKMIAVFDQAGNLVGIADPDDITPVISSAGGAKPADIAKAAAAKVVRRAAAASASHTQRRPRPGRR